MAPGRSQKPILGVEDLEPAVSLTYRARDHHIGAGLPTTELAAAEEHDEDLARSVRHRALQRRDTSPGLDSYCLDTTGNRHPVPMVDLADRHGASRNRDAGGKGRQCRPRRLATGPPGVGYRRWLGTSGAERIRYERHVGVWELGQRAGDR